MTPPHLTSLYPFTLADHLKKHFDVYGLFYDIRGTGYRSCLEIVTKDSCSNISRLIHQRPDAIVTMMNPGSSRPLKEIYEPHIVNSFAEADKLLMKGQLIPTHPDPTQYQVERIMLKMNWNHVRVINLADLRQAKSNLFAKSIHEKTNSYSLFSPARRRTLDSLFQSDTVICGWGMDIKLTPLINPALDYLKQKGIRIVGQPVTENSIYYRHPSPMIKKKKVEWLEEIEAQLG